MINWYNLLLNACWILGCALALAIVSYSSWEASKRGETFWKCLHQSKNQITLNIGGLLFALGLAGTTVISWQRVLWIILGCGFLVQIVSESFRKNKQA